MELLLRILIFIIGAFFGSFFTLAVHRLPKKEDILIKHSYCPNCNNKLGFFDLFPIFSYIFLGGKCRYCKNKIKPRYLILEVLSGITFVLLSINIDIVNLSNCINVAFTLFYISILFIIAGIDKEYININRGVVLTGYIIETIYIIYQCTLRNVNVYQYVIYLLILIILLILSNITLKITTKQKYFIQVLYLTLYIIIFTGSQIFILTTILTLISLAMYKILSKEKNKNLPIGFFLSVSNILVLVFSNLLLSYIK